MRVTNDEIKLLNDRHQMSLGMVQRKRAYLLSPKVSRSLRSEEP